MKAKIILLLSICLPLLACDRLTKNQAVTHLKGQESLSFLDGILKLTYHENTGAMLSLGGQLPEYIRFLIFTVAVTLALLTFMVYLFIKPMNNYNFTIGLLMISGGFGNLYDRAFNDGRVVDFMLLQFGPVRTGVFNVADMAIMAAFFGYALMMTKWGQKLSSTE